MDGKFCENRVYGNNRSGLEAILYMMTMSQKHKHHTRLAVHTPHPLPHQTEVSNGPPHTLAKQLECGWYISSLIYDKITV